MDTMPPGDMPSDDLQIAIREAQATLIEAGDGMPPRDPMRFLMAGLSAVLGVLGRSTSRWEKAVSDIIAARSPITDNDRAAINHAMEDGAFRAVKQEINRITRRLDLKQSKEVGLYIGGAFLLAAVPGLVWGHYAWSAGYAAGEARPVHLEAAIGHTLTRADAEGWLMLMENNELARAPRACGEQGGRQVCTFAFWNAPAPPPTGQAQAAAATPPTKARH